MHDETAWLVEYDGKMLTALGVKDAGESIQYLSVSPKGHGAGELTLHADPNRALRFARQQDAEAALTVYAGHTNRDSAVWIGNYLHAREHMWPAPAAGVAPAHPTQENKHG